MAAMHIVIKAFPCSFDGINAETLKPGDVRDFGSMAAGLVKAGYIKPDAVEPSPDDDPEIDSGPVMGDGEPGSDAAPSSDEPAPTAVNDPEPETVEIPDDWRDLSGNKMKSLAAKLSPDPIRSKADAAAAIEAEIGRRAAGTTEDNA
jgi:hypothetical protein